MIFVFFYFTSLSVIISKSFHVAENGIISFFLMAEWKTLWCWEGLGAGGEGDNRG